MKKTTPARISKEKFADNQHATTAGFTLIELLVSMALFTVVLTMGVGSLLVLLSANAKAQNMQSAVSNVQFALDSMAREIRTGVGYYCTTNANLSFGSFNDTTTQDCGSGSGTVLSIVEGGQSLTGGAANKRITYRYNSTDSSVERKLGSGSWVRITDPAVNITDMRFNVLNTADKQNSSNVYQPTVTIYIAGQVQGKAQTDFSFDLQTTVARRVLDL